jgi:hypothetical protein
VLIEIPIESGIPIPPRTLGVRNSAKRKWPFRSMKPYDSFLLVTDFPERESRLAYIAARRLGIRIAIRNREGGIRVWRVPNDLGDVAEVGGEAPARAGSR